MKISELFKMTKEQKEVAKTKRIIKSLKRSQEALVDKLEEKKEKLEEQIDDLLEISTDNFDSSNFVDNYFNYNVELNVVKEEIKIAKLLTKQFYTD